MDDLPKLAMEAVRREQELALEAQRQKEGLSGKAARRQELGRVVDFVFWRVFWKLVLIQVIALAICLIGYAVYLVVTGPAFR